MSAPIPPPSATDPRLNRPVHDERHIRVICIGAGASGLLLAYKLQRSFENYDLVLYEKNEDIGGTWLENVYPGCACDVPAHTYTWSFEPNKDYSSVYASSKEIFNYFSGFANKYDLRKFCKFQHRVSSAIWNERLGLWDVEVTNMVDGSIVKDRCNVLINATGVLNSWKMPDVEGLDKFKGHVLHTAKWDTTVDLTDKHVGIIGNGSSGIQILSAIAPTVKKITAFIRTVTWVAPVQSLTQHIYTPEERNIFATDPAEFIKLRKSQESAFNSLFPIFIAGSDMQNATTNNMRNLMRKALKDESLDWMIPNWGVGCRRLSPGVGYLETISSDKVDVVKGGVKRVTETGCVSEDGTECPVDLIICATGFETSFMPRFPVIGRGGVDLREEWSDEPRSYFGLGAAHMPNYFSFLGPNSPFGNGPVLVAIEAQADYMLKFINRYQTENIHSFVPNSDAIDEWAQFKNNWMQHSTWTDKCKSWYKNSKGIITAVWPGSTLHYLEVIQDPRYEDWDFKSKGNRFTFVGNGFSQTESDMTADWAHYITDRDDSPYLSRSKQRKVVTKSGTVERKLGLEVLL